MKKKLLILIGLCSLISAKGQTIQKDTLYFNYPKKYIQTFEVTPNKLYLKDSSDDGTFFFEKLGTERKAITKNVLCLKRYVRTSEFYDRKKKKRKLNDYRLWEHLNNYEIFLVKENEYIKVRASFEIE